MTWDFITTFPMPQFEQLRHAGRASVFEGSSGDELEHAVRQTTEETALSMQADLGDALSLVAGLQRDIDPRTGTPPRASRYLEMRYEAEHLSHTLAGELNDYQCEFGDAAMLAFVAHYLPELPGLAEKIAACPTQQGAGPLFMLVGGAP